MLTDLIKYVPQYLSMIGSLATEPRTYLRASIGQDTDENLQKAFTFAALSFVIAQLLLLPNYKQSDQFIRTLIYSAAFAIVMYVYIFIAISAAWRWVGAPLPPKTLLIIVFYWGGVAGLLETVFQMLEGGIFSISDSGAYMHWQQNMARQKAQYYNAETARFFLFINRWATLFLALSICVWSIAPWQALVTASNTTRKQSICALGIFIILFILIGTIVVLAGASSFFLNG